MKRVGLLTFALAAFFALLQPSKASAQQYEVYGGYGNAPYANGYSQPYGGGGFYYNDDRRDRRWREREWKEHERQQWREHEWREREHRDHDRDRYYDRDQYWDRR